MLAVCGTCNNTVDLQETRQAVAGGHVIISCAPCLEQAAAVSSRFDVSDTRADTASPWLEATLVPGAARTRTRAATLVPAPKTAFASGPGFASAAALESEDELASDAQLASDPRDTRLASDPRDKGVPAQLLAGGLTASNPIEVVDMSEDDAFERADPTAPARPLTALESSTPPPAFRTKHLAVAGTFGVIVGAVIMFAPGGSSTPSATAPASINTPIPTEELSPFEQAVPDQNLAGISSEMSPTETARRHRDAIRERKRAKTIARNKRRKRVALKGRRFRRFSLGVLPASVRAESWIHPLPGISKPVSTGFGAFGARRSHRYRPSCGRGHCGYDLKGPWNMPVVAVLDGTVELVVWRSRRPSGRYVIIKHAEGLRTWYMHLHRPRMGLRPGMSVRAGEEIGRLGTTGLIQRIPHLHFSLEKAGKFYVDPEPFLSASTTIAKPRAAAVEPKNRM